MPSAPRRLNFGMAPLSINPEFPSDWGTSQAFLATRPYDQARKFGGAGGRVRE